MGLPELVARLERDAAARVAAIEAAARQEIAAIEAEEAREESAREAEELAVKRAARAAANEAKLSLARRRANAEVLAARHAAFERVFARALELLQAGNADEAYRATVAGRLRDALEYAHAAAVVRCRPDLVAIVDAIADVVCEDAAMPAGFVVEAGAVIIDETLPSRLARMRDALAMDLAKELGDG